MEKIQKNKRLKLLKEKETAFQIQFHKAGKLPFHTNGMRFSLIDEEGKELFKEIYYSVGGGFIVNEKDTKEEGEKKEKNNSKKNKKVPFPFSTADELFFLAKDNKLTVSQLVMENEKVWMEEKEIKSKLDRIWQVMRMGIERGIQTPGVLPGPLKIERRAPTLYQKLIKESQLNNNNKIIDPFTYLNWINCWALAVSEENSVGGQVVTAPTNGSAGVIPAVVEYYEKFYSEKYPNKIHEFLLTAGAIGMIIKQNATVSGAEGGCQAEIGSASSMAAAGLCASLNGTHDQIENAAEIALEHFIGLTCDPVGGVVQIPCIERNAVGAVKAVNAAALALNETNKHKVSLDRIIRVMKITGDDMKAKYKETSKGGIAKIMEQDFKAGLKLLKTKDKQDKESDGDGDINLHTTLC